MYIEIAHNIELEQLWENSSRKRLVVRLGWEQKTEQIAGASYRDMDGLLIFASFKETIEVWAN